MIDLSARRACRGVGGRSERQPVWRGTPCCRTIVRGIEIRSHGRDPDVDTARRIAIGAMRASLRVDADRVCSIMT